MFITLKYSNFSVNVVFLSGVCLFWGGGGGCFFSCGKVRGSAPFCFDLGSAFEQL